jgi:Homeodomain-like domain
MAVIQMSERELTRLRVLIDLSDDRLTIEATGTLLGLGRRQIYRLRRAFAAEGTTALVSRKRGRAGTGTCRSCSGRPLCCQPSVDPQLSRCADLWVGERPARSLTHSGLVSGGRGTLVRRPSISLLHLLDCLGECGLRSKALCISSHSRISSPYWAHAWRIATAPASVTAFSNCSIFDIEAFLPRFRRLSR